MAVLKIARPCDPYAIPESFRAITIFMEMDLET